MKKPTLALPVVCLVLSFPMSLSFATNLPAQDQATGLVSFNTGRSPVEDAAVQSVSLFGCHNTQVDADLFWDTEGQVVGHIPYGWHESGDKPYFVGKYYVASPPVFRHVRETHGADPHREPKENPFVGLVIPDRFSFEGERPAQVVNLDYRILEPTYLHSVGANFDFPGHAGTCRELGVEAVPINTDCPDFPWRNGALGASGIGQLTADGGNAFVPSRKKDEDFLQCNVTLLDDVVLHAEVFFVTEEDGVERPTKSLDLTALLEANETLKLLCTPRPLDDIPSGCLPQEGQAQQ